MYGGGKNRGRLDRIDITIILIISLASVIIYFNAIDRYPLVVGIDAPYYMIQIREILRSGSMKYADPPLTFYILSSIAYFIGDIRLGFITGDAILSVLAAIPFYIFIRYYTGKRVASIATLLAILYSPYYIRMLGDFVKNQFGVLFIGLLLITLTRKMDIKARGIYSFLFTILAGVTHFLDYIICLVILFTYFIHNAIFNRRIEWGVITAIFSSIIIYFLGYIIYPFYFEDLGRLFGFISDVASLESNIRRLPNPNSYIYGLATLIGSAIVYLYKLYNESSSGLELLSIIIILDTTLIFPWNSNWVYRLLIMLFIPVALLIGYITSLINDNILVIVVSIIILSSPMSQALLEASRLHPSISPAEYMDFTNMSTLLTKDSIVIFKESLIKRYWAEYILDVDLVRRPINLVGINTKIYIISRNEFKPPPHAKPVYIGRIYTLYEVSKPS